MQENEVTTVVAGLRERGVLAHVARPSVFTFGVRIALPDGREVLWDVDGAAGLEAQIMQDGMLVGFIPEIPGSGVYSPEQVIDAIAATQYPA